MPKADEMRGEFLEKVPEKASKARAHPENKLAAENAEPSVTLAAFVTRRPEKDDQLRAFQKYAERKGLQKLSPDAWAKELDAFQNRPIGRR